MKTVRDHERQLVECTAVDPIVCVCEHRSFIGSTAMNSD